MKQLHKNACRRGEKFNHFVTSHWPDIGFLLLKLNYGQNIMDNVWKYQIHFYMLFHLPSPQTQILQWMPVNIACFDFGEVSRVFENPNNILVTEIEEVANEEAGLPQLLGVWRYPLLSGHSSLSDPKFVELEYSWSTLVDFPSTCISNTLVFSFIHTFLIMLLVLTLFVPT